MFATLRHQNHIHLQILNHMKKTRLFIALVLLGTFAIGLNWAISNGKMSEREKRKLTDPRIDNIQYWIKAAEKGLVPFNPEVKIKPAVFTGSDIVAFGVLTDDSPDVPVTEINSTQSENSIFVDPNNPGVVLNSNNSTANPVNGTFYGANDFFTFDKGESWEGEIQGAGVNNTGDPTTAIGLNGRWYVNYIDGNPYGGMGCSYSDDQGESWTVVDVAPNPGQLADKNHMWIDNSPDSPHEGNLYVAWTNFTNNSSDPLYGEIGLAYSHDNGESWTYHTDISSDVNAFNQGVNLSTGPNGEVYATWAIYESGSLTESAIGFAKSLDGGVSWEPAVRIITNIRGIRQAPLVKHMRWNSFPAATVDISDSTNRGTIYITWTNIGTPGENTGNDMDVYIVKSTDQGDNWSEATKINQDEAGLGKKHYFPWITCDPKYGTLSAIFYDDRNVGSSEVEVFCANSKDGGETWEDFKVSDVSFSPSPIPGTAQNYFGDYLGITAQDGWVYPVWTDNRLGHAMTYVSPYETNPLNRPNDLVAELTFETGAVDLSWTFETMENFLYFNLYRDGEFLTTVDETTYTDMLPSYGVHFWSVTAAYTNDLESGDATTSLQWGDAHISVSPTNLSENLAIDEKSTQYLTVINTGQLDLNYTISALSTESRSTDDYCEAASLQIDEYISRVQVGDIDNSSVAGLYSDYTNLVTSMRSGESYPITVTNGKPYPLDLCAAWIDWDGNGIFDEDMIEFNGVPGGGPYTAIIIAPLGAKTGMTRLRIRLRYTGELLPCGTTDYGEVEDYSINVQGWLGIDPVIGTILPGDTSNIAVNFDATDMEAGNYSALATFYSNDPDANETEVDIALQVSQFVASISVDNSPACAGESVQMNANVSGEADTLIYAWYSVPGEYIGETSEVTINPEMPTAYYVTVTDTSGHSSSDTVFVMVYPLPVIELGADTSICGVNTWTLDAGNPGSTYLWSTGETTQTIEISTNEVYETIDYMVTVTTETTCVNSGEIKITWVDCTSIDELNSNVSLNIFPNPNDGEFSLQLNALQDEIVSVRVVNELGAVVFSKEDISVREAVTLKINLQDKAAGIYSVIVSSNKGMINKKVVVK